MNSQNLDHVDSEEFMDWVAAISDTLENDSGIRLTGDSLMVHEMARFIQSKNLIEEFKQFITQNI